MSRGVRLAIGITMIVLGGLALVGAGGLLAVFGLDNTATSPTFRVTGNGRAVIWGTGAIRSGTPLPARYTSTISLHVRAGDKDVFVGIGPQNQVARYLAGAATDRATSVGWPARVVVTTPQPGQAVPPPPDQQTFWAAKASGPGTQSVDWSIQPGTWAVVIMNADASPGVDVIGRGSLKIGAITPIMIVLGLIGLGLVGGGIAVLIVGRRRNRYDADEPVRPNAAPAPVRVRVIDAEPGREPLHRALALTDEEYARIVATLGREPNHAELAMFAAMWSEHCSYKSSKVHLRTMPTRGPQVLVGPGQDAGVVDLGDGVACVFKMESHSHPSAIEPYQGAATGVGGIVRDILSMGARPAALLDPLRFGTLTDPRNRYLFGGVVAGIGGYGNCIGVPTVGGEVKFAACHAANPTVDVMCVGFADASRLLSSPSARPGDVLVLIGARTGRDGIGGVSVLASRTLDDDAGASRPSVQIGDPFTEKLLIEACLELKDTGLLVGLQDLGGAGLTCAVSESASRVGMGAEVSLDDVPLRQAGMEPFEILTSESQERMLAICRSDDVDAVHEVCRRWGLASDAIGHLRGGGALRVKAAGTVVADVPARALADEGPVYERPMRRPAGLDRVREDDPLAAPFAGSLEDAFAAVVGSPSVASKRWVSEQYDSIVQGGTVVGPGADAAVIRLEGTIKAVAVAVDGNGRYGHLDPYLGGAHAVAEAARNVATVGARPLAITNCLNFGNPERPEVMWAFAESVRGISDACRALNTPVTGGNVSFYNEAADSAVYPTPIVGVVGLVDDYRLLVRPGFAAPGLSVYLLGETLPELGGSEFAEVVLGKVTGRPPALDLEAEARLQRLLHEAAVADLLASGHDCADGGLAVALAECAMAGGVGFTVTVPDGGLAPYVSLFSESASRAVVTARDGSESDLEQLATVRGVPLRRLGLTGGTRLEFTEHLVVPLQDAVVLYEGAIPRLMAAAAAG